MINAEQAKKIAYEANNDWMKEMERIEKLITDAAGQGFMFVSTTVELKDAPFIKSALQANGFRVSTYRSHISSETFSINWE